MWTVILLLAGAAIAAVLAWQHSASDFPQISATSLDQWQVYGGNWHTDGHVITDRSDGLGDKLIAGPKKYGNYSLSAEVRFDSAPGDPQFGDAGLLLRVMDPAIGVDAHRGFYAGVRLDDHSLQIGAQSFTYREVANTVFPRDLHPGHWYRLTFAANGCTFHASLQDPETQDQAEVSYVEPGCKPLTGQVGLRSYYARASWRDLKVKLLQP